MNRRKIVKAANEDTPTRVQVPDSLQGVFIWALGRFGVAVIFVYAAYIFYQDQRSDQALFRQAFEKSLDDRSRDRAVLERLIQAVEELGRQHKN